jgi:hypothetical protein
MKAIADISAPAAKDVIEYTRRSSPFFVLPTKVRTDKAPTPLIRRNAYRPSETYLRPSDQ